MLEPRKYKLHLFLSYLLGYCHKFSFYIYVKLHKTLFHTVNTHLRLSAFLFLLVFFIPSCISEMLSGIIFLPSEELCGFFSVGLTTNSLNFYSSRTTFISPSFLKVIFCWMQNSVSPVIFFQHLKDLIPLPSGFHQL